MYSLAMNNTTDIYLFNSYHCIVVINAIDTREVMVLIGV